LPLTVTHGCLGSVIELLKIVDLLTNPDVHGARFPCGDFVIVWLRVFRKPTTIIIDQW
jgi:hypothetical protein